MRCHYNTSQCVLCEQWAGNCSNEQLRLIQCPKQGSTAKGARHACVRCRVCQKTPALEGYES